MLLLSSPLRPQQTNQHAPSQASSSSGREGRVASQRAERGRDGEEAMSSLTQPMPYYPTTSSSPITRAQPATASRGSFVPVFTVLGVISFLAVVACVAGRLCGRRLSRKKASYSDQHYYGSDAVGGDLEKGFEAKYPPPMKPMPSSRAVIHDMDDGFEIKFAPGKPAAWKNDSKPDTRGRQHPQVGVAMPREYAGFRYPAAANGVVRQGQVRSATFVSAKP